MSKIVSITNSEPRLVAYYHLLCCADKLALSIWGSASPTEHQRELLAQLNRLSPITATHVKDLQCAFHNWICMLAKGVPVNVLTWRWATSMLRCHGYQGGPSPFRNYIRVTNSSDQALTS